MVKMLPWQLRRSLQMKKIITSDPCALQFAQQQYLSITTKTMEDIFKIFIEKGYIIIPW